MTVFIREPVLHPTPIADLRPTQITLGLREVERKRQSWRERDPNDLVKFLSAHMAPVVVGPGKQRFLVDHHHLARALHDEGAANIFVTVVADLHRLDETTFWNMMDYHGWTHPFDAKGRRCDYAELPKSVEDMTDDPYRSLAGELRLIGGFAKDSTPYSEFVWADFLRTRVKAKQINNDFEEALKIALDLAKSEDAGYLPGWCAPHGARAAPVPAAGAAKANSKR